jgi:tRNA (guanine-N7-)-methyltransferase
MLAQPHEGVADATRPHASLLVPTQDSGLNAHEPFIIHLRMSSFVIDPRQSGFARVDLEALFGNANSVVVEIGSGKGRFLISSAMEQPGVNFIGIEKSLHYHRVIQARVERRGLTNVRLINHDAFVVLQKMIGDASLAEVHVYFPDPWPRPKEQKRRIIRAEVLTEIRRVLAPDGQGIFVTDHRQYYEKAAPLIEEQFRAERRIPGPDDPPRTNYEAKYRGEGRAIYEIRFFKS